MSNKVQSGFNEIKVQLNEIQKFLHRITPLLPLNMGNVSPPNLPLTTVEQVLRFEMDLKDIALETVVVKMLLNFMKQGINYIFRRFQHYNVKLGTLLRPLCEIV